MDKWMDGQMVKEVDRWVGRCWLAGYESLRQTIILSTPVWLLTALEPWGCGHRQNESALCALLSFKN